MTAAHWSPWDESTAQFVAPIYWSAWDEATVTYSVPVVEAPARSRPMHPDAILLPSVTGPRLEPVEGRSSWAR